MSRSTVVNIIFLGLTLLAICLRMVYAIPVYPFVLLILLYLLIQAYGSSVLSAGFSMPARCSGHSKDAIAITFDDGPIEGLSDRILDILKAHQVQAAFFCIGSRVRQAPDLLRRIHAEGHIAGNHSYHHRPTFGLQSSASVEAELRETDRAIEAVIGLRPAFFRPPYGVSNPMIARALSRSGHIVTGWSLRSLDTMIKRPEKLLRRLTRSLKAGDIILLHDYSLSTIEILPALLNHISKKGLRIERLDTLLKEPAYV